MDSLVTGADRGPPMQTGRLILYGAIHRHWATCRWVPLGAVGCRWVRSPGAAPRK